MVEMDAPTVAEKKRQKPIPYYLVGKVIDGEKTWNDNEDVLEAFPIV